jgi:predicted nucleotidyltransferase
MNTVQTHAFIGGTVERLARSFVPERIVLFGSYAKGTARPDSDVDLLVVANLVGDLAVHERRARHLVAGSFPRVDVVLCTPADLAEAREVGSMFLLSAIESGVTVFDRPRVLREEGEA